MIKKKVKKIPKYADGAKIDTGVLDKAMEGRFKTPSASSLGTTKPMASLKTHSGAVRESGLQANGFNWENTANVVASAAPAVGSAFGIEQGKAGAIFNTAGDLAQLIPGVGTFVSAGLKTVGAFMGDSAGYDKNSASTNFNDIYKGGSGILSLFDNDGEARRKAAQVQSANIAKQQTESMRADYMNNPNVVINPTLAAEGGIMRQPVDALVSKGELIYNPMTKKLSKVPGSKGKPNKADDVYARLYEGDVVISNSPTMVMANGKTPAQNLEGLADSDKNIKAKEAIIKKVVNWQEANKTKPQEYAMYNEGEKNVRKKEKVNYVVWNGKFGYFDASGGFVDMSDVRNDLLPDSAYLGRYERVPVQQTPTTQTKSTNVTYPTGAEYPKDPVNIQPYEYKTVPTFVPDPNAEPIRQYGMLKNPFKLSGSDIVGVGMGKFYWPSNNTTAEEPIVDTKKEVTIKEDVPVSNKKENVKKTTSKKVTPAVQTEPKRTPEQIAEQLSINDIGERHWLRGPLKESRSLTSLAKVDPITVKKLPVSRPINSQQPETNGSDTTYTGSNWRDNLYRMAVLSQPLWDRAEVESVNYESPVYKHMPTAIDVTSQLRDTDQSYALARYNFANLYPNTGAGMAAGLQAASNRAKQYADIRQYQTNAQNELIGKNVGIYNNWANEHARIMNDVYNKAAANRATARNINRQNRAAALNNYGQMLRDDRQYSMDTMKLNMLEPLLSYGTENSDTIIKKARKIING